MSQDPEPGWQGPDGEVRPGPAALDNQYGDLIAYCRAVTGREEDAVSTAHGVLDSARSLLTDPARLRAWLFVLARMQIVPADAPQAQEIFDLLHRHGIRREDLPVVLGISPVEADELLAAAENEVGWDDRDGCWDDTTHLSEDQPNLAAGASRGDMFETQLSGVVAYCRTLTSEEDAAVSAAHAALDSARSLLSDPDRLRAWLFGLARQDLLGDVAPAGQEILDLVHEHAVRAEDLPIVLGIPANEAGELLVAAEDEYASTAVSAEHRDAEPRDSESRHDDTSWDDRAATWDRSTAWDDDDGQADGTDWDGVFGPKTHRLQDAFGLFRKPAESAGRHAKPGLLAAGLRWARAPGAARAAAAAGIVVAVIGASTAYLAMANSSPPGQASHQTKHRPHAVALFPATTPSPTPTATPTQPASQPVTVVQAPPAPTSTSPRPASSAPGPSPPPSPSSPPSPTPTPTPTPS